MKKYEKPEIKIASFDSENVVSTSAGVNLTKFNTTNKYTSIELNFDETLIKSLIYLGSFLILILNRKDKLGGII